MRKPVLSALAAVAALAVAGCGGGGSKSPSPSGGSTGQPPVLGQPSGSGDAPQTLGFPGFATKNTTRVGGSDPVADAAGVALAMYPSAAPGTRPQAVTLVDVKDWRTAISAAQLTAGPLRAPILMTDGGELPEASRDALDQLRPTGAEKAGKAQAIRIGDTPPAPDTLKTTDLGGADSAALAAAIDRLQIAASGKPSTAVIVAPSDRPAFAMPAAGYAAKSGVPILWSGTDTLPAATRQAIRAHDRPAIYVLGPESAISAKVLDQLRPLGEVRRIDAPDPVRLAVAFARFSDGAFGWNVVDPGHGLVFASAERPADAAAAAGLSASGKYGPLLLVQDAQVLPQPLEGYLLDIQPGYDKDPVRGVYNHGWVIGDEEAISVPVQARIDALLEIQPVDRSG